MSKGGYIAGLIIEIIGYAAYMNGVFAIAMPLMIIGVIVLGVNTRRKPTETEEISEFDYEERRRTVRPRTRGRQRTRSLRQEPETGGPIDLFALPDRKPSALVSIIHCPHCYCTISPGTITCPSCGYALF